MGTSFLIPWNTFRCCFCVSCFVVCNVEKQQVVTMGTGEDHVFKGRVVKSYGSAGDKVKTSAVCVAPSDDVIVVCHGENVVVYKKSGEEAGRLVGHRSDVTCCSITHDLLATTSTKGIIILWKYREMKRVARIGLPCGPISACSLSVSGRYLAVAYADRKPRVYTLQAGDGSLLGGPTYKELEGHGAHAITDMKFSTMSDDNLMTSANDGTVKFWKVYSVWTVVRESTTYPNRSTYWQQATAVLQQW